MRKARPLALVGAGPVSRSFLAHLPALAEHLGPVKSLSFRVASRIANALRAGFPVAGYAELDQSRVVLIRVPAGLLCRVLAELAAAPVDWHRKVVVLCDVAQDRAALARLADRGAATASLAPLEGFDAKRLLVEGDPAALAALRRLLAHGDVKLVELRGQSKAAYLAGVTFLTTFSAPLMAAASDCLRLSGLSSRVAATVVERLSQRTLRSHLRGGKRSVAVPLARELDALQRISPRLAARYASAFRLIRDGA